MIDAQNVLHLLQQGGGTVTGLERFVDGNTKATWIATFTMLVMWFLFLLLVPIFKSVGIKAAAATSAGAEGVPGGTPAGGVAKSTWTIRVENAARAARDSFVWLLGLTLINESGRGITPAIVALAWVSFVLLTLWVLSQLLPVTSWMWLVDYIWLIPAITLIIIAWALSFRVGTPAGGGGEGGGGP